MDIDRSCVSTGVAQTSRRQITRDEKKPKKKKDHRGGGKKKPSRPSRPLPRQPGPQTFFRKKSEHGEKGPADREGSPAFLKPGNSTFNLQKARSACQGTWESGWDWTKKSPNRRKRTVGPFPKDSRYAFRNPLVKYGHERKEGLPQLNTKEHKGSENCDGGTKRIGIAVGGEKWQSIVGGGGAESFRRALPVFLRKPKE